MVQSVAFDDMPQEGVSREKIIMELSFPHGHSPNDGIDIYNHFGKDISYFLPSIADLITKLQIQGPGSWIWKVDLSRANQQIRIDPLDTPLEDVRGLQMQSRPSWARDNILCKVT